MNSIHALFIGFTGSALFFLFLFMALASLLEAVIGMLRWLGGNNGR